MCSAKGEALARLYRELLSIVPCRYLIRISNVKHASHRIMDQISGPGAPLLA